MSEKLLLIFEIMGTVAFAVSGAMVALSKKMDIFGVITLGLVTSVGGGVIRDLILGNTPPVTFQNPLYALVAIGVSALVFVPSVRRFLLRRQQIYDKALLLMDSLGLGIFTAVGIETACMCNNSNPFLLVFVGVITATGGGIIRDVLAGNTPYIFIKHFYATASLIGAAVSVILFNVFESYSVIYLGGAAVIILRLMAAKFRWSLPKADGNFG